MSGVMQDVRYAVRAFARNPGFAAAAILSLAIGVGANTSIFSVASALLLRPLPYQHAGRLVILWSRSPGLGIAEDWFSTAQYFDIKSAHQGLEEVAIAIGGNDNLTGDGEPERIGTIRVSSNLLPMLGVRAALGRLFVPAEDRAGGSGAAVLNHGTWVRRYGSDPRVVGRSIVLNGQPFPIVGVLPAGFSLPREVMPTLGGAEEAEVLVHLPLAADAAAARGHEDYNIIGTLKPGVSVAAAQAEMDAITARLRRDHPDFYPPNGGLTFGVVPLQEQVVGEVRRALLILIASVGFVLLVACANVANLQLSRALARQKEIAIRTALGASRARVVRQLLTESVLLALAGGALGLLFSFWSLDGIRALGSRSVPRLHEIGIHGDVLLFTLAISVASGILFGLAPALRVSGRPSALWGRGQHTRRLLVMCELALSVMLLVGAGLLVRSFVRLQQVPAGFNPARTLTLELSMSGRRYNDPLIVQETYRQLWNRLARIPGAVAAGGVSALPLSQMFAWGPITVEGRPRRPGEAFINVDQRTVGGDYFRAMEIPLLEGRLFNEQDTKANPRVVIVDDYMARQIWPNESALGKRIRAGGIDASATAPWLTVVGVVGRVKQYTLDGDSRIAMYLAHTQVTGRAMNVVVWTAGEPAGLASAAVRVVRSLDPDLPIYNIRTMEQRVDESLARRRFSMLLLTLFAALALALAAIGIYGVIAYLVTQGTRDLAIRMALGATPQSIVLLILRHGMSVALIGVVAGLAGAFVATGFMRNLLFGVAPSDPVTFAMVSLLLTGVALVACYVPARRAARIDPMVSLRSD
jgi:putative ABC transport system permease protein